MDDDIDEPLYTYHPHPAIWGGMTGGNKDSYGRWVAYLPAPVYCMVYVNPPLAANDQ